MDLQLLHYIHGCGQPSHGSIHTHFAGPFMGKLLVIHSEWLEVFEMTSTTSAKTIAVP